MSQTTSRVTSTWSTGTGPPPEISYHSWTSLEECTDRELSGKRGRERQETDCPRYRRIAHGRGGLSSHRTRRHNNPPASSSQPSTLSSLSAASRDAVDPIAELLSQLSGVRRVAGSSSSQLQQLQMELQLQRQQAQAQRQTLDRLARRPPASSGASQPVQPSQPPASKQPSTVERAEAGQTGSHQPGGFLLSSLAPDDISRATSQERDNKRQEIFLTSLLLGALSLQSESDKPPQS